jgi:CBS domain-containing membrane protein
MTDTRVDTCVPVTISDDDIYDAMKDIPGYLDITPGDFKEVYVKAYQHALQRLARSVKAREVMTRNVVSVRADTPLTAIAETMAERGISGVPVVNESGEPVGVISEKDILSLMAPGGTRTFMRVVADCLSGSSCLAAPARKLTGADVMSSPAISVSEDALLLDVADILTRKGINRVPVVDKRGAMTGIICRADVVRSSVAQEGS